MIPVYPIAKIAKKMNARISKDALEELNYFLNDFSENLAKNSIELSKFAQRNTVMKKDIEFAFRRLRN